MIALDIGGTKTSLFFSEKENLLKFIEKYKDVVKETNKKQKFCIISTFFNKSQEIYNDFFLYLKDLDGEIISTFPGIIKMERIKGEYKFKIFSRRFPFLIGKYLPLNFAVNDVYAFSYYHARKFFKDQDNRNKTILSIQIGTGINGVYMNYYDYRNLLFLNKTFEMGHITMDKNGEKCFCGRRGCAELYVSGKYLEKIGKGDPLNVFTDKNLKKEYYENLSSYMLSLVLTICPDKIVLGGSVSKSIDIALLHNLIEKKFPHFRIHLNIEYEKDPSMLSNLKGLIQLYKKFKGGKFERKNKGYTY